MSDTDVTGPKVCPSIWRRLVRPRSLLLLALLSIPVWVQMSSTASPIPVPNPLVKVVTQSGGVTRTTYVPISGAPVPIDVDNGKVLGMLAPDIDVSVGVVAAEELPGRPIVPVIDVKRNITAILRHAPAPPLRIDATIKIDDAANSLQNIATVTYGFETPPGGRMPPQVRAKLLSPIAGGFVDPLEAQIDSPGYNGPLKFNVGVQTPDLAGQFALKFDPLPQKLHFVQDPRPDGLDFFYDHTGPNPDVKLDAGVTLRNRHTNKLLEVAAVVERLPHRLELHNTNTPSQTRSSTATTRW